MKNILIVAAEHSAENYGAQVIDQFKKNNAAVSFFGVGGDRFLERGVDVIVHNKELAIVGIVEIISSLVKIFRVQALLVKTAVQRKADAVILIDYPDFNIRIAKKFKKLGIPVYYYISPTVWAWRYSRVKLLKKYVHHLFIIFPFEVPIYEKEQVPFTYTGHPLLPAISVGEEPPALRKRLQVKKEQKLVTLLPGSRNSEIHSLLPVMLQTMALLREEFDIKICLLKAGIIERELIDEYTAAGGVEVTVVDQDQGYNLINASDIVLTTCGTSNLEIAVLGIPFTAVYHVNRISYFLGKPFVKISLYSIVNILAQKEVVKEWIQREFTPENILGEMRRLLTRPQAVEAMRAEFARIRGMLQQDHHPPEIIYDKIAADLQL